MERLRVLAAEPGNRMAQELATTLAREAGEVTASRALARDVPAGPPFAVKDTCVWTEYANGVFFGGANDARVVAAARAILGMPTDE